ncbi:MAG: Na/Pi cotransporter family protein [bacterium]|jgi:phosphate:Na+ symporter|nr:Na/Pi cotransporter family protein [bacterium]
MDWKTVFFQVFGGLGLFLMGMKIMSEGMQKTAGDGLKRILNYLTINRYVAVFVGFLVTAVIQSSSATTVMIVGFVNAGLMTLTQAIGVVLGANIGTTVTGWIVTLPVVKWALPMIGFGVMLRFFSKSTKWRYTGEIIFGFGILFLGMTTMGDGFKPLRSNPDFINFFKLVSGSSYITVFLGVFIGTVTTVIVQSSSATIGIAIALATQGLLTYEGAAALVLGDNIGTTITALLAAIGANYHAKRAAIAHTVFNVMGVVVVLIFFYPFDHLVDWLVPGMPDFVIQTAEQAAKYKMDIGAKPYIGTHIAMFHSLFNITNVIVFTPLIGVLAKVVTFIIPTPKEKEKKGAFRFSHIHFELIDTPAIGIAESEKELVAMANRVKKNGLRVRELFNDKEVAPELFAKIEENENLIDEYRKMITSFLLSLSQKSLSERDSHIVGNFITAAANLEKFADFLANIAVQFRSFKDNGLKLSKEGQEGLASLTDKLMSFFDDTVKTLEVEIKDTNEFLKNAEKRKRELKAEIREAKISHFNRLKEGKCMEEASMIYIEMLTNLDGMASQVHNIAEVGAGHKFWT